MGQHADRNAQFENIAKLKEEYVAAGHPVISIDTKKKEMLGNVHREGVTDAVEPTIVNDHDFASASHGKVIPHGIYDVAKNQAHDDPVRRTSAKMELHSHSRQYIKSGSYFGTIT